MADAAAIARIISGDAGGTSSNGAAPVASKNQKGKDNTEKIIGRQTKEGKKEEATASQNNPNTLFSKLLSEKIENKKNHSSEDRKQKKLINPDNATALANGSIDNNPHKSALLKIKQLKSADKKTALSLSPNQSAKPTGTVSKHNRTLSEKISTKEAVSTDSKQTANTKDLLSSRPKVDATEHEKSAIQNNVSKDAISGVKENNPLKEKTDKAVTTTLVTSKNPESSALRGKDSATQNPSGQTVDSKTHTASQPNTAATQSVTNIKTSKPEASQFAEQVEKPKEKAAINAIREPSETAAKIVSGEIQHKGATPENTGSHTDISPAERAASVTHISTRHTETISRLGSPQSAAGPSETLSPAQQILRGMEGSLSGETRRIDMALVPAGLGMVRINLQREGDEISGLLQIEKTETRREIEKSLPQIIASLDGQGIQIRKIEIASMPNSQQRQSGFEGTNDWSMNREMTEHGQNRNATADPTSNKAGNRSTLQILTHDKKKAYDNNSSLDNLNLFA